jgi:hypothetical protein
MAQTPSGGSRIVTGFGAAVLLLCRIAVSQPSSGAPPIGADEIGGTVTSARGPEAGVWVIAETQNFQVRFAKIVVTDEAGRYLIPRLPGAKYRVWVRGYGLADSAKVDASPGRALDLAAIVAPDASTAARIYPAAYWYAMMKIPEESQTAALPGGRNGYLMWMKNMGCVGCHQLGNLATRTLPKSLGTFKTSQDAWLRRVQAGQAGISMINIVQGALAGIPIRYLAEWTDRIAAGELPAASPTRPSGIERNVVATVRDWSDGKAYLHDLSGTDRRTPTVNGNGLLYGAPELSSDNFPVLDPLHNLATTFRATVRDADTPARMPTIPCSIAPAESGTPREFGRRPILRFASKARAIRPPRIFPSTPRSANWRCTRRRAANIPSSTPASALTICNLPKTRTIPSGPAAVMRSSAGSTPRNSI